MLKRFNDDIVIASGIAGNIKGVKSFDSGKRVCEFSVAADYVNKETVWANIKAWGSVCDIAALVKKGDPVIVTGRYEERQHEGKTYKSVVADCVICPTIIVGDAYEAPPTDAPAASDDDGELPF